MIEWLSLGNGPTVNWVGLIGRALWLGSLILVVVWFIFRLLQGTGPKFRFWFWIFIYLRLLSGFLWVNPLERSIFPHIKKMPVLYYDITATNLNEKAIKTTQSVVNGDFASSLLQSIGPFLIVFWLCGVILLTMGLIFQYYRKHRQFKNWFPVFEPLIIDCYENLGRQLKLRKMPRLLTAEFSGSPFLKGFIQPAIYLPDTMTTHFKISEIKLILAHELAHYKRGDLYWNWLPAIIRNVFFFHPLVWLAEREWTEAQEMCCDNLAIRASQATSGVYGDLLLRMAVQPQLSFNSQPGVFYLSETKQTLKKRIMALKPLPSQNRFVTAFCMLLIIIVMIAPWQMGFRRPFPVCMKLKYKAEYKVNLNRYVNVLYILYYIPYIEQENIEDVKIYIGHHFVPLQKWDKRMYEGWYDNGTDYPFKGSRNVTIQAVTKTGIIQRKYPVLFHKDLEWYNF